MKNTAGWLPSRPGSMDEVCRVINFTGPYGLERKVQYLTGQIVAQQIPVHLMTLLSCRIAYCFHTVPNASQSYFVDLLDIRFLKHEQPVGLIEPHANIEC